MVITLKLIHIASAIVAVGTNLTYFYWLRRARSGGTDAALVLNGVWDLDRKFANPAYTVLPITGIAMVILGDYGFSTFWVATAIVLFVVVGTFAGFFFTPALKRQLALAGEGATGSDYAAAGRRTMMTGAITMTLIAAILFLMVVKPRLG